MPMKGTENPAIACIASRSKYIEQKYNATIVLFAKVSNLEESLKMYIWDRKGKFIQWPRPITGYKAMAVALSVSHNQYRVCPSFAWCSCTSLLHKQHRVLNCHLWDIFPLLLGGYTQLGIVRQKWMSATNCLIKDVPHAFYWAQIRIICWPIMQTGVFIIQIFSADTGDVWSSTVVVENGAVMANVRQDDRAH